MGLWGKRDDTVVHEERPFNAEPVPDALDRHDVTPVDTFFSRNHADIQQLDPDAFRLDVDGLVERPLRLSLAGLRERFAVRTVVATLQCAGNRRAELAAARDIPGQVPWGPCAVSTAEWTGAALADVLAAAGLRPEAGHVAFLGAEAFGGSIPVAKATAREVLLAWGMNGAPLPPVHGGPLRVVVPGYIGARSVKWLRRVTAQERPSDNRFQARDYRLLPADADPAEAAQGHGLSLGVAALNAAVLCPQEGRTLPAGPVRVSGYAAAGDGRAVARVDVSVDGGRHWRQADLGEPAGPWAWRRWRLTVRLPPGTAEITARAWDDSAAVQPERVEHVWNPSGYMNTAWSTVRVTCVENGDGRSCGG
ncbi:sulfite oxidase [Dactylosporangium fulvum]|uniref:Sulfite oxidase n=1 Tax=Dactylosporangium fulvum TaxID=53359 RepID=A0ABY5VQ09_9ACTN|nr:sulfite oxidase [Dactylosporangium fulvum]UWP78568.1 sulfite oxidase [Dactylosporangium fulvum]